MNHKTFCIVGLLLIGIMSPSRLPAQNLILDGGFESGTLVNGFMLHGATAYGVWSGVIGQYGWTIAETGSNKVLSACGKGYTRDSMLYDSKRMVQEVSDKSVLPGKYTLKFKCQCDPNLLNVGHMTVAVAQRTEGPAEIIFHIEKTDQEYPTGYSMLTEMPLLTGQPSEITAPDVWRTVEINFEVPVGGKSLLVMFYGMVDTGSFRVDDVSLTREGDSPVHPEKSAVNSNMAVKPLKNSAVAVVPKPAPAAIPAPAVALTPAVAKPRPAEPASPLPRPAIEPVHPPVDNLILNGDFSAASLALPAASGDTTTELSGRWLRSAVSPWEISPYGGNLGPYARAAASKEASRLLYVASDVKRSKGSYQLRFDYIVTNPSDVLGVKVFVSDRDITVGTDGGDFRMNSSQRSADMIMLPGSASWATYSLPVELGSGYNYIYVLFAGSGAGNTGIDNISLSPCRR